MDFNIVVLSGRIATEPDIRHFASGTSLARLLLTVRSDEPRRRVDVIPVTLWDPPAIVTDAGTLAGRGAWIAGSVQRRFWASTDGGRSRIEVVAHAIELRDGVSVDEGEERAAG